MIWIFLIVLVFMFGLWPVVAAGGYAVLIGLALLVGVVAFVKVLDLF